MWACACSVGGATPRRVTRVLPQCLGDIPGGQDPPSRGTEESIAACPLAHPSLWVTRPALTAPTPAQPVSSLLSRKEARRGPPATSGRHPQPCVFKG